MNSAFAQQVLAWKPSFPYVTAFFEVLCIYLCGKEECSNASGVIGYLRLTLQ